MAKIISLFSFSAKSGKTTIALELSCVLSRILGQKVLLIDGDPNGVISSILNIHSAYDLTKVMASSSVINPSHYCEETIDFDCYAPNECNKQELRDLLFHEQDLHLFQHTYESILYEISRDYDYVIVDTSSLYLQLAQAMLPISDLILCPVNPISSDLKKAMKVGERFANEDNYYSQPLIRYVLNQSDTEQSLHNLLISKGIYNKDHLFFNSMIDYDYEGIIESAYQNHHTLGQSTFKSEDDAVISLYSSFVNLGVELYNMI